MTYPAVQTRQQAQPPQPATEPKEGGEPQPNQGKTPQAERYKNQRDQIFALASQQSQDIRELTSAVKALISSQAQAATAEKPKASNPADPWSNISDQDLQAMAMNKELDESVKFQALQRLMQRQMDAGLKEVTSQVKQQLDQKVESKDQKLRMESALVQQWGSEAFDSSTDFGRLRQMYMDNFVKRFARNPGDDLSDHPVYMKQAVELAAEQLGIEKRKIAASPGSGKEGGESPPQGQQPTEPQTPSKSGPPASARLSGGAEGAYVSTPKVKEALQRKDNKAAIRGMLEEVGF